MQNLRHWSCSFTEATVCCCRASQRANTRKPVHMPPSAGKFELFMRGLACNIVGVRLAGDDVAAGKESCWSSLDYNCTVDVLSALVQYLQ